MFGEYPPLIKQHTECYFPMEEKWDKVSLPHIDMPVGVLISYNRANIILLAYSID